MKSPTIRMILAPLLSVAFFMVSSSFFMSYISLKLQYEGFSEQVIGYVHSAYYAGMLLGATQIPRLIDYVGHIRVFSAFVATAAATMMLLGLVPAPYAWIPIRFINGISLAAIYVVIESWLLGNSTAKTHGRVLSSYMITLYLAQASGQMFLSFVNYYDLEAFLMTGVICVLGVLPVCLVKAEVPQHGSSHEAGSLLEILKISPFGAIGCAISGVILSSIYSFGPNYAQTYQIAPSILMGTIILGGVVLQWPIGKLSDVFNRRTVLIIISFVTVPPCLLILSITDVSAVLPMAFILGGLSFTVYPLSVTHVCDRVAVERVTCVAGVLLVAYGCGSMTGPLITPYFMEVFGDIGLFISVAFFSTILGIIGIISEFYRPRVPKKDQGSFLPVPRTTPLAIDLDPRIHSEDASENR